MKIAVLPGDGIGPEIVAQAVKVLEKLKAEGVSIEMETAPIGGAGYDASGDPLPEATLRLAREADAVLLGAGGGPQYDTLDRPLRPERGLLRIRKELNLFANLRPALLYPDLAGASSRKPEVVSGLDIMIVRELTGDVYVGQPRGIEMRGGERVGYNTMVYSESEVRRVAHVAFGIAMRRRRQLCSVEKANVLECSELWKEIVIEVGKEYPEVALTHMYVDNAAMQLVRAPKQFDVIVTGNIFGDILSDEASMLTGSIGMLPSASLDANNKGMYEPIHGSAPDVAGKRFAILRATILSVSMRLRYTLGEVALAVRSEAAVQNVLAQGYRTADIYTDGTRKVGTAAMGDAVVAALRSLMRWGRGAQPY